MAQNIFLEREQFSKDRPRNVFDLSFTNHLTMKFGTLYPVFCKEVLPGDSFHIKTAFGLQFMPMVFPVQTRMRAHMHYFYVRNRNLWKNWEDYIFGTKNSTPPYISQSATSPFWSTGSLADYLGVPTTRVGAYGNSPLVLAAGSWRVDPMYFQNLKLSLRDKVAHSSFTRSVPTTTIQQVGSATLTDSLKTKYFSPLYYICLPSPFATGDYTARSTGGAYPKVFGDFCFKDLICSSPNSSAAVNTGGSLSYYPCAPFITPLTEKIVPGNVTVSGTKYTKLTFPESNVPNTLQYNVGVALFVGNKGDGYLNSKIQVIFDPLNHKFYNMNNIYLSEGAGNVINTHIEQGKEVYIVLCFSAYDKDMPNYINQNSSGADPGFTYSTYGTFLTYEVSPDIMHSVVSSINDGAGQYNPFTAGAGVISALPFRAYQSIYNGFYRNQKNNPFVINGQVEYNKYITTDADGADVTPYELYQRDWEKDFLTSAVQSPQMGLAPLVGLITRVSPLGTVELRDPNTGDIGKVQFSFAQDGKTIEGFKNLTNLDPTINRMLVDAASMGISIDTFRQVNAFQRWLETNMRRGFRYRDLIKGQYDVDIKYDEVDMPEFIGGFSRDVQVTPIHQMVQTADVPLGDLAGNASLFGSSEHSVSHYCDEHGFIIGILCVVPEPSYSQLLPKHFTKLTSPLDYYFPEFGKIGMQPIQYKEVCPTQAYVEAINAGTNTDDALNAVFGYQRPWYDYIASTNEVHGHLRTDLKDYLMNRVFDTKPVLGQEFLQVDPKQLNDVFAVATDDDDKIVGQVIFEVSAKRQIPRIGIPALE